MRKIIALLLVCLSVLLAFGSSAEEFAPVEWSFRKTLKASGGYARMCDLSDGSILAVYENGNLKATYSEDDGATWKGAYQITSAQNAPTGDAMVVANPNAIQLSDGRVLCAYRAHTDTNKGFEFFYSSIRVNESYDNGRTWSYLCTVVENTGKDKEYGGYWEPEFAFLPDGKLAVYYADDCLGGTVTNVPSVPSRNYQYIIMHTFDEKTGSFGDGVIVQDGVEHKSRDGMPEVCRLSDGGYAMAIEATNSGSGMHIRLSLSKDGVEWTTPKTIASSLGGDYAGAPSVACLPDGRIVVSFQADYYDGKAITGVEHKYILHTIVSNDVITYESDRKINVAVFTETELPLGYTGSEYNYWAALHLHGNYLFVFSNFGINTSATERSALGLRLARATVGGEAAVTTATPTTTAAPPTTAAPASSEAKETSAPFTADGSAILLAAAATATVLILLLRKRRNCA